MIQLYYCSNDDIISTLSREYTPQNGWQRLLYCRKGFDVGEARDKKAFLDGKNSETLGFLDSHHPSPF